MDTGEYRWRALDDSGAAVTEGVPDVSFPTQADAESWFSETWEDFAEAGVASVTLLHFEDVVYGPMPLSPA